MKLNMICIKLRKNKRLKTYNTNLDFWRFTVI